MKILNEISPHQNIHTFLSKYGYSYLGILYLVLDLKCFETSQNNIMHFFGIVQVGNHS